MSEQYPSEDDDSDGSVSDATRTQVNAGFAGYGRIRNADGSISYVDRNRNVVGRTSSTGITRDARGEIVGTYSYRNRFGETITGTEEVQAAIASDAVAARMADAAAINAEFRQGSYASGAPTAGEIFASQKPIADTRQSSYTSYGESRYGFEVTTNTVTGVRGDVSLPKGIFAQGIGRTLSGEKPVNPYSPGYAVAWSTAKAAPPFDRLSQAEKTRDFFKYPLTSAGNFLVNKASKLENAPIGRGEDIIRPVRYLVSDTLRGVGEHPVLAAASIPSGYLFGAGEGALTTAAAARTGTTAGKFLYGAKVGSKAAGIVLGGIYAVESGVQSVEERRFAPIFGTATQFAGFGLGYSKGVAPSQEKTSALFIERFGGREVTPRTAREIDFFNIVTERPTEITAQRVERVEVRGREVSDALFNTRLARSEPVLSEPVTFPKAADIPASDYFKVEGSGVRTVTKYGYPDTSVPATANPPPFTTSSEIVPFRVEPFVTTNAEANRLATPTTFYSEVPGGGTAFVSNVEGSFTLRGVKAGFGAPASRIPEGFAPFYGRNRANSELLSELLDVTIIERAPKAKTVRGVPFYGEGAVLKTPRTEEPFFDSGNGVGTVNLKRGGTATLEVPFLQAENKRPGYDFQLTKGGRKYRNVFDDGLYVVKEGGQGVKSPFETATFGGTGAASMAGLGLKGGSFSRFRGMKTPSITASGGFLSGSRMASETVTRFGTEQRQGFDLGIRQLTGTATIPAMKLEPGQLTIPKTELLTTQRQKLIEDLPQEPPGVRPRDVPPFPAFGFPAMIPPFGGGRGERFTKPSRGYNYAPSLTALFGGTRTGKARSAFTTGLENRPIIGLEPRSHKHKRKGKTGRRKKR